MTQHDNCSKSKAKTMLENKIWAQNLNFWNLNIYPQIGVFLLSPSNSYHGRKMKTRGWSPTEFVWRLCQIFSLKMAPRTKDLQCFHIKWTHCTTSKNLLKFESNLLILMNELIFSSTNIDIGVLKVKEIDFC